MFARWLALQHTTDTWSEETRTRPDEDQTRTRDPRPLLQVVHGDETPVHHGAHDQVPLPLLPAKHAPPFEEVLGEFLEDEEENRDHVTYVKPRPSDYMNKLGHPAKSQKFIQ